MGKKNSLVLQPKEEVQRTYMWHVRSSRMRRRVCIMYAFYTGTHILHSKCSSFECCMMLHMHAYMQLAFKMTVIELSTINSNDTIMADKDDF